MIQDISPHEMKNQFHPEFKAEAEDTILNIFNGKILVDTGKLETEVLLFPQVKDFLNSQDYEFLYLFSIDEKRYFLLAGQQENEELPDGYDYVEERQLRTAEMRPKMESFAASTGKHLSDWYRDNQFCGRCGGKMVHSKLERAMTCTACGYTSYPRIMPAVIVGVINKNKLLVTKYRTGFKYNALIAGFTEIGETAEETVAREVMEETGVKVKNIRYYKTQPWGTANDLLLGYFCDLDGNEAITVDENELKSALWLAPDEIELQPGDYSLTNEMMKIFKEGYR